VVTAAIKEGGQPNAAIVRLVQTLSAQLNVPLQAHRVTSGGELVWSVDTNAVAQQVASHLERRDDIQRALPITADTSKGPGYQNPNVLIEFTPDSKYAKTLAKTLQESPTSLPVWQGFSRSVGNDLGLPLTIQPEQVPRLILAVHMESLLAELVERLRQRSDVEYAQPNFLLQPHMDR